MMEGSGSSEDRVPMLDKAAVMVARKKQSKLKVRLKLINSLSQKRTFITNL